MSKKKATPTTEATHVPNRQRHFITQKAEVLAALQAGDRLTPMDALGRFGCFRLASVVCDLKHSGYPILSRLIVVEQAGQKKRVAEYWMDPMEPAHGEQGPN